MFRHVLKTQLNICNFNLESFHIEKTRRNIDNLHWKSFWNATKLILRYLFAFISKIALYGEQKNPRSTWNSIEWLRSVACVGVCSKSQIFLRKQAINGNRWMLSHYQKSEVLKHYRVEENIHAKINSILLGKLEKINNFAIVCFEAVTWLV